MSVEKPGSGRGSTDWSKVEKVFRKTDPTEGAKEVPKESAEDGGKKGQEIEKMGAPEGKEAGAGGPQEQKLVDKIIAENNEQLQGALAALRQRTYDEIKKRTEEHRQEHGTEVSPAELEREDQELRKKLEME